MKNSHPYIPHVPHVPHVQPVSQKPQALFAMGFTRAKTPNGCSAIIWDEKLLPQDTDINIHNSLQENELEEK